MRYSIIKDPYYATAKIGLELHPDDEVVRFFFTGIILMNVPKLIYCTLNSRAFREEEWASVRFYHELDWEDKSVLEAVGGIKKGEVSIYHQVYGDTVISEQLFKQILLDYSTELLKVCLSTNDNEVSQQWIDEMEMGIIKLKDELQITN